MMVKRRKIAVLGALSDLNPAYSIATVALDHLFMLREAGEDVVFITTEEFKAFDLLPNGVEVRTFPRFHGFKEEVAKVPNPPKEWLDEFDQYVFEASACLRAALEDITHCITHDVLFLSGFLWVGWAVRRAAESCTKIKFYHWVHSGPSKKPEHITYPLTGCYMPMQNSIYCYPNRSDIPRVAEMFGCRENDVQCVYNTVDPVRLFDMHPISRKLIRDWELLSFDVLCVYPTRVCSAKQPDKLIKLLGALKRVSKLSVCLVICNTWSTTPKHREELDQLQCLANMEGLDIRFTSLKKPPKGVEVNMEIGVPKKVVMDLLRISDIFILPSISETASLVLLEAGLSKNFIVVNEDLLCMREFTGQVMEDGFTGKALQLQFGSVTRPVKQMLPSEQAWYAAQAEKLLSRWESDPSLSFFRYVKRYHNPKYVYENQLKPLLDR